ncbi:ATP-binding protein [Pelosinus sp. sgz500959]|uniref:ATP-binding protein n=1 Tax=Pelosinus sp. sgz500959 TaxID=3242472 RepID=UPI00366AADAF
MYYFSSLAEFATLRETIKEELARASEKDALHIFVAINEGVNNAIFHGNKEDRSKKVHLMIEELPYEIKIIIRDEGKGFANQGKREQVEWSAESGRGFEIIQHCVDSYHLNELGNELTLIKKFADA